MSSKILRDDQQRRNPSSAKVPYMHELRGETRTIAQSHTSHKTQMRTLSGAHALEDTALNTMLREYEVSTKRGFDEIEEVVKSSNTTFANNVTNNSVLRSNNYLPQEYIEASLKDVSNYAFRKMYAKTLFAQFLSMSAEFFTRDPLGGQDIDEVKKLFSNAGFHAVGVVPCSDGRLAHLASYVLRIPYGFIRRKAHAGALFDISESVRNWVFVEHSRFRDSIPNDALKPTKYLKIAVYHYSSSEPSCQGCAAHGNNESDAALAALQKLKDFKQAIENRFGSGTTVQTLLIGIDTDNDSLKIHVPNAKGNVCVKRFVETSKVHEQTLGMDSQSAKNAIASEIDTSNTRNNSTAPDIGMHTIISWFIRNNLSQIAYVKEYEQGIYSDIGHAERFIGIGNGLEEVQLRNLSYYSFLDTVEEGINDVDIGIKIFKDLNVSKGLPIPIVIRCDFDGRVPSSKDRAMQKAQRINKAVHTRYKELSDTGYIETLLTIRDYTKYERVEVLEDERGVI